MATTVRNTKPSKRTSKKRTVGVGKKPTPKKKVLPSKPLPTGIPIVNLDDFPIGVVRNALWNGYGFQSPNPLFRSFCLLYWALDRQQRVDLMTKGYFYCKVKGRDPDEFRIVVFLAYAGNIFHLGKDDGVINGYCLTAYDPTVIPFFDTVLSQKILLENLPNVFFAKALRSNYGHGLYRPNLSTLRQMQVYRDHWYIAKAFWNYLPKEIHNDEYQEIEKAAKKHGWYIDVDYKKGKGGKTVAVRRPPSAGGATKTRAKTSKR